MHKGTQAVFLDLDGPILEGKYRHYACYADIIQKDGGKALSLDEYWKLKRKKTKRDEILRLSEYPKGYDDFFSQWLANIEKPKYLELDRLKPDAAETLYRWKETGISLYLVTLRQSKVNLLNELVRFNILRALDEILCCDYRIKQSKLLAIQKANLHAEVFIGDTEQDEETAKALHIPFFAIVSGLREKQLLKATAYYQEIFEIEF